MLVELGFDKQRATEALERTKGDVDEAINLLCDECNTYFY
jgi:NACalpha-BTF3-like transcription factor